MGQKVNPRGLRVGVIQNWDSRWFTNDEQFGDTIVSDYNIRKYLKKELQDAGVPKIEIERDGKRVRVLIYCAKPGMVIGRGGEAIEKYKNELVKMVGGQDVKLEVVEVKQPDMNAQLVAENIASQLERRVAFRRAMKMAIRNTMRQGAKGIKVTCGGRLGGAEIARVEHYHEGSIPLQTLRADIDYGFWEANTTYGKIGIKVWIYKGEVLSEVNRTSVTDTAPAKRDDRRGGNRGDRRDNRGERRDNRGDRRDNRRDNRGGRGEAPKPVYNDGRAPKPQKPKAPEAPAATETEGGEQ